MKLLLTISLFSLLTAQAFAASKPHVMSFGRAISGKWFVGADENHALEIKVRPLYVDGRLREFTLGPSHDVTDHLFVVRRAFHINDSLPTEENLTPRWRWQRGGWLLVDRLSGHITQLNLPEFDNYYSSPSWYRDYVAYCGVAEGGKKFYAVVAQLGRKKPILKQSIRDTGLHAGSDEAADTDMPDSECQAPSWQRQPTRVTFDTGEKSFTYSVRGHDVEALVTNDEEASEQLDN